MRQRRGLAHDNRVYEKDVTGIAAVTTIATTPISTTPISTTPISTPAVAAPTIAAPTIATPATVAITAIPTVTATATTAVARFECGGRCGDDNAEDAEYDERNTHDDVVKSCVEGRSFKFRLYKRFSL
ncbi:hypothetical protein BDZ97DRAFT_1158900 [Flammula alnicola]|nr:hypothetical protein BDZ97DRAFT_1158900 [Flammula alnicola]